MRGCEIPDLRFSGPRPRIVGKDGPRSCHSPLPAQFTRPQSAAPTPGFSLCPRLPFCGADAGDAVLWRWPAARVTRHQTGGAVTVLRPPLQRWPYFCRKCLAPGPAIVLFAVGSPLSLRRLINAASRLITEVNRFITAVTDCNAARRIWYIGTTPRIEAPPTYVHAGRFRL